MLLEIYICKVHLVLGLSTVSSLKFHKLNPIETLKRPYGDEKSSSQVNYSKHIFCLRIL